MTLERVLNVGDDIAGSQDVDRGPDLVQAAKDVQRMMLETGKRLSRKQEVDRDAIRDGILRRHCAMLADSRSAGHGYTMTEPRRRAVSAPHP